MDVGSVCLDGFSEIWLVTSLHFIFIWLINPLPLKISYPHFYPFELEYYLILFIFSSVNKIAFLIFFNFQFDYFVHKLQVHY